MRGMAIRMACVLFVRMSVVCLLVIVMVNVIVRVGMIVVRMRVSVCGSVRMSRVIAGCGGRVRRDHVDLGGRDSGPRDFAHLKARADVQCCCGRLEAREGDAGIDQRAQHHVAAYAGKTLQISNAHRGEILSFRCDDVEVRRLRCDSEASSYQYVDG